MYKQCKIFKPAEIRGLSQIYHRHRQKSRFHRRLLNVFNVHKLDWYYMGEKQNINQPISILDPINNVTKLTLLETYFLEYTPGSFTHIHRDYLGGISIVTLIENNNLVGGQNIFYVKKEEHPEVCPVVLNLSVGDSVIYKTELLHGVSEVFSGSRLVLVSWFGDQRVHAKIHDRNSEAPFNDIIGIK